MLKNTLYIGLILFLGFVVSERMALFVPLAAVGDSCEVPEKYTSGEKRIHVLELFTSEGCSSCPPAEKWLNSLYDHPKLYKDFIPLAFHVDYWDYIGHKDPQASPVYSQRQRSYSSEWGSRKVYTPGFVLNGEEWRPLVKKAPTASESDKKEGVSALSVMPLNDGLFKVHYKGEGQVSGALLAHGIENKIRKGENRGKTLHHNFIVKALKENHNLNEKNEATFQFDKPKGPYKHLSAVFWVTHKDSLKPLQAAGGCYRF